MHVYCTREPKMWDNRNNSNNNDNNETVDKIASKSAKKHGTMEHGKDKDEHNTHVEQKPLMESWRIKEEERKKYICLYVIKLCTSSY